MRIVKGLFRISRDDYFWLFGVTLVNKLLGGLFRSGRERRAKVGRQQSACPRARPGSVRSNSLILTHEHDTRPKWKADGAAGVLCMRARISTLISPACRVADTRGFQFQLQVTAQCLARDA